MGNVLLLSLLPVAGNLTGGLLAEYATLTDRWLNRALHAAAGVVVAVVAIEIMPRALPVVPGWQIAAAFTAGGLAYLALEYLLERRTGDRTRMWMIYLAVATDLLGDGLMIGAGGALSAGLGLTLAVGQVMADIPEGFAAIFNFRANDVPRRRRLLLSALYVLPALLGAAVAYLTLRGRPETVQLTVLAGTAGLFTVAVFEDMIHEAHEAAEDTRLSTLAMILGFAAFTLVSAGLG